MVTQVFIGPLIHTQENGELIVKKHVAIFVNIEDGKITAVVENPPTQGQEGKDFLAKHDAGTCVRVLSLGEFIIPGFIDCHTHAVQLPNLGLGYDKSLLDWLETYTFPLERKFEDMRFADDVFRKVLSRTIATGTTTACYFASLYSQASVQFARRAAELGQRAFIGKVNMNIPREDGYYESTEKSIKDTVAFVDAVEKIGNPLVRPIITPRFALSCDMNLMQELAKIAKLKDLHIQSHVSENKDEIIAVQKMFPEYCSYAAVYDAAGLLTNKTVLAHGVHLKDSELAILKERGTAIIHCPTSNLDLKSGLCDVQRLRAHNIKIGLGTDVSGGSSCNMLEEMRSALKVSNSLAAMKENYVPLNYKDVFHMATLGGAQALSIDDKVGNLVPGKEFDALIINLNSKGSLLDNFREYTLEEKLQRFIYSGDDRNVTSVYVKGAPIWLIR